MASSVSRPRLIATALARSASFVSCSIQVGRSGASLAGAAPIKTAGAGEPTAHNPRVLASNNDASLSLLLSLQLVGPALRRPRGKDQS
jgi:hypothetical protein